MSQLPLTGNGAFQRLKKPFMERRIKVVLRGNPHSHRQECLVYGMTLSNHITLMDKVATKIRANHQPDQQWHPVRTTDWNKKIPMLWTVRHLKS